MTSKKILESKVVNLNLNNFLENKITKIAERFILKKADRSPLKKIKLSEKINININKKNNLLFFFKKNIDKSKKRLATICSNNFLKFFLHQKNLKLFHGFSIQNIFARKILNETIR